MKIQKEQFDALVAKLDALQRGVSVVASEKLANWLNSTFEKVTAIEQEVKATDKTPSLGWRFGNLMERISVIEQRLTARNEMLDGMARDMKLIFKLLAEQSKQKPRRKQMVSAKRGQP